MCDFLIFHAPGIVLAIGIATGAALAIFVYTA